MILALHMCCGFPTEINPFSDETHHFLMFAIFFLNVLVDNKWEDLHYTQFKFLKHK